MYLDLPTEIQQLNNKRHAEQRMLNELLAQTAPIQKPLKDIVINLNSGKPVEPLEPIEEKPEEPPMITKPFRPQRRTHIFNRRRNGLNQRLNSIRGRGRPLGQTPTMHRPKSIRMLRRRPALKVNKIPNPSPMPELKKPNIMPVRPPTPIPYKYQKEENKENEQVNEKVNEQEQIEETSNLVDQIFNEFEMGTLDSNKLLDQFKNTDAFKALAKDMSADKFLNQLQKTTSDMVDTLFKGEDKAEVKDNKFLDQLQETTSDMVDRLFSNIIKGEDEIKTEEKMEVDTELKEQMNQDWVKFNQDMFNTSKPYMPEPKPANSFAGQFANFKPLKAENQSLLHNEDDVKAQNSCRQMKNSSLKLDSRLSKKKPEVRKCLKQMVDNFEETNDQLITPAFMVEQLIKVKNRILLTPHQKSVELTNVCVNPHLINKIRTKYYERYPINNNLVDELLLGDRSKVYQVPTFRVNFGFDSGRLLAVLDRMINKYRCLSDDRKILDQTADLGEEIADVVEEYADIQNKLSKLSKFNEKLDSLRQNLMDLSQMSHELDFYDGFESIDNQVLNDLRTFQEGIQEDKVNQLILKGEQVQAKFNYYQKMANELISRVQVISSMPTSDLGTYQLFPQNNDWNPFVKNDLTNCFLAPGHHFEIDTTAKKPVNCQLRRDPPIEQAYKFTTGCNHFYPFDLAKKNQ